MVAALVTHGWAQHSDEVFDVVSIKPSASIRTPRAVTAILQLRPGQVRAAGITAQGLISLAYPTGEAPRLPSRIAGGPEWLASAQFEFIATTHADVPDTAITHQLPALLRSTLADRFKLKGHLEMRPVPIFALVKARRDGTLGPWLRRTAWRDVSHTTWRGVREAAAVGDRDQRARASGADAVFAGARAIRRSRFPRHRLRRPRASARRDPRRGRAATGRPLLRSRCVFR